jgi:hypothetical protein
MSAFLRRETGNTIRVKDLMAALNRANPDAFVFVREGGFLVMPAVREVIASPSGVGLFQESPGGDDLPSVLIE